MDLEPKKDSAPVVIRSEVDQKSNYQEYKHNLRRDFYCSCAYCSLTEVEAMGIRFEIDHYLPKSRFKEKEKDYQNLMWSCEQCNNRKSNYYPTDEAKKLGYYVIRVDEENPHNHIKTKGLRAEAITETGEFNIQRLDLNRQTLIKIRKIRKDLWENQNILIAGIRELLKIGIDNIKPKSRMKFQEYKSDIIRYYHDIAETAEELIQQLSCSSLIDEDNESKERLKKRRKYLNKIEALTDDIKLPTLEKHQQHRKTRKKKKRK